MSYELQAAYEISSLTYDYRPDAGVAAKLRAAGLHHVVRRTLAYCPITDATLRNPREAVFRGEDGEPLTFPDAEAALAHAHGLTQASDALCYDDETSYAAFGPDGEVRPAIQQGVVEDPADVPF